MSTRTAAVTAAAIVTAAMLLAGSRRASPWLSVKGTADALGTCEKTVRRMIESGEIEGAWQRKEGSPWKIPRAWVMREIAERQKVARASVIRRRREG